MPPATGERDLTTLLASSAPQLLDGTWVFTTATGGAAPPEGPLRDVVAALVVEDEGPSLLLPQHEAVARGLPHDTPLAWITLQVHSALDAVGLTAAVSQALAAIDCSCNVVAGRHHDHLLVPHERRHDAMAALHDLAARARTGRPVRRSLPRVRLPAVTVDQMREVDRVMVDELGISLVRMMEHAGRSLAELAVLRHAPVSCVVLAGAGSNGGGGLVAARHLHNRGVEVTVVLADDAPAGVAGEQLAILRAMGVAVAATVPPADLVLDAVVGIGLHGPLRERPADLVLAARGGTAPVLSLDVPSGLDATTGEVFEPCVRADATLTLALPKHGLLAAPSVVGELHVADISVPASVPAALGLDVGHPFAASGIVVLAR